MRKLVSAISRWWLGWLNGYREPSQPERWQKVTAVSLTRETAPMRCFQVSGPTRLFAAGGDSGVGVVSHNSVAQRCIVAGCVMRPEHWIFIGIDIKQVELGPYRLYDSVAGIAITLEEALEALRFVQETVAQRYAFMLKQGASNYLDLKSDDKCILVMIDEVAELLALGGGSSERVVQENAIREEIATIIDSVTQIGRAAGVHLVNAMQRPDANVFKGRTKYNVTLRVCVGPVDATASTMILGSGEGIRIKPIKGRSCLSANGVPAHFQGFFISKEDLDQWHFDKYGEDVFIKREAAMEQAAIAHLGDNLNNDTAISSEPSPPERDFEVLNEHGEVASLEEVPPERVEAPPNASPVQEEDEPLPDSATAQDNLFDSLFEDDAEPDNAIPLDHLFDDATTQPPHQPHSSLIPSQRHEDDWDTLMQAITSWQQQNIE